jgi:glutathione synthase/RimK-type ligase-like ATP-grasp enzyme
MKFYNQYKSTYKVISTCFQKLDYKKINKIDLGNIVFLRQKKAYDYKYLTYLKIKINFIPYETNFTNKLKLSKLLKNKKYHLKTYLNNCNDNLSGLWIEKPKNKSCGKNITIVNNPKKWNNKGYILQKYIENPHLINNKKWDIRILVALKGNNTFYYNCNGIIRSCHEDYIPIENFDDINNYKYRHLTNVSIQYKKYPNLEHNKRLEYFEHYNIINKKIDFIIKDLFNTFFKKFGKSTKYNYGLFGFDFIVDNNLNVYLIEINSRPQLREYVDQTISKHNDISYYDFDNIFPYIQFIASK